MKFGTQQLLIAQIKAKLQSAYSFSYIIQYTYRFVRNNHSEFGKCKSAVWWATLWQPVMSVQWEGGAAPVEPAISCWNQYDSTTLEWEWWFKPSLHGFILLWVLRVQTPHGATLCVIRKFFMFVFKSPWHEIYSQCGSWLFKGKEFLTIVSTSLFGCSVDTSFVYTPLDFFILRGAGGDMIFRTIHNNE